jgi:hypothetical protein
MRTIALWARFHPVRARILIIVSHLVLSAIALYLSLQLFRRGIQVPVWMAVLFIALFVLTALFYPEKKRGIKKSRLIFLRQKTCDLIAVTCGFGLICFIGNQAFFHEMPVTQSANASMIIEDPVYKNPAAKKILDSYKSGEKTRLSMKEKRILKNELKFQLGQYALAIASRNKQKADTTSSIILAVLAAAGLLYLVAALACNLSCSGSETAAVIVLILGVAGIIVGLVYVIRSIKRKARKKAEEKLQAPDKTM